MINWRTLSVFNHLHVPKATCTKVHELVVRRWGSGVQLGRSWSHAIQQASSNHSSNRAQHSSSVHWGSIILNRTQIHFALLQSAELATSFQPGESGGIKTKATCVWGEDRSSRQEKNVGLRHRCASDKLLEIKFDKSQISDLISWGKADALDQ